MIRYVVNKKENTTTLDRNFTKCPPTFKGLSQTLSFQWSNHDRFRHTLNALITIPVLDCPYFSDTNSSRDNVATRVKDITNIYCWVCQWKNVRSYDKEYIVVEQWKALFNCLPVSETTATRKFKFLHKYFTLTVKYAKCLMTKWQPIWVRNSVYSCVMMLSSQCIVKIS